MTGVIITFIAGIVVGFFGSILLDLGKPTEATWSEDLQQEIDDLAKRGRELHKVATKLQEREANDQE